MNTVSEHTIRGIRWRFCTCGAKEMRGKGLRFLRRHPGPCFARRAFNRELAQTTRHLDDLEVNA